MPRLWVMSELPLASERDLAGSPQPSRPLVQQLMEWFRQFHNLWSELVHLVDHAQKLSKLCGVGWCLHVGDSFDLV